MSLESTSKAPYEGSGWISRVKPSGVCGQGIQPKNLGTEIAGRAASRKISSGRKSYRGMASDGIEARERNRGQV